MLPQYHLKLVPGDVAPTVLLPGDPKRVEIVARHWDKAHKVADNREYITFTGEYKGAPITCTSTGIGAPSTAIALEELARVGATTFIRIGTCGALQAGIPIGTIAIFDSAARYDGASHMYAPPQFPAVASHEVVAACMDAARGLNYSFEVGTTRSTDAFYARGEVGNSFHDFSQSDWKDFNEDHRRLNIKFLEMESSVIFVLSRIWGLRAGGISVVINTASDTAGQAKGSGQAEPGKSLDYSAQNIERLVTTGCEVVRILHEQDSKKNTA